MGERVAAMLCENYAKDPQTDVEDDQDKEAASYSGNEKF